MRDKTIELSHSDDYIAGERESGILHFHQSSSGNWFNLSTTFGHGIATFRNDIWKWIPESIIHSLNKNRWEENPKQ